MKLFISADMEGIAGVVSDKEVSPGEQEHQRARRLMTQEVNAALKGAFAAGVTEAVVADAHASMTNILPEELDPRAHLVRGAPRPMGMMEGLDASFSAVFFIGYHARRGTAGGVLEHTYSGRVISRLQINGHDQGELGLNAYLAGHFGVPVLLVTGDHQLVREGQELLKIVEGVQVKQGLGRYAASSLHPEVAREKIRKQAHKAVKRRGEFSPLTASPPVDLDLVFPQTGMADHAALMPGAQRKGGCHIHYRAEDYLLAYRAFRVLVSLAAC